MEDFILDKVMDNDKPELSKKNHNNEIVDIYFLVQANKTNILELENPDDPDNPEDIDYLSFFEYLKKKNIINCSNKNNFSDLFGYCLFNKDLFKNKQKYIKNLKKLVNKKNKDYPDQLQKYKVDHTELFFFLKNYVYKESDEAEFINKYMRKGLGKAGKFGESVSNLLYGKEKGGNKRFSKKVKPNKKKSLSKTRNKRK